MLVRDVQKTSMQHETDPRRTRRRKRGRSLYVLMALVLAVATMVTLSMTVFFNIKTIRVTGNAEDYTISAIVEAAEVEIGDNMMRLNVEEAERKALSSLIHVESVEIKRQFPDTLEIHVEKCTPAYNVVYQYGTLVVSEHGRILEKSANPENGLVKVFGYEPEETTPGYMIRSQEERSDKIFSAFRELIYKGGLGVPIVSVDMQDPNDIMVNFGNRITFDMGNWNEIDYKISFAEQIIAEQPADKQGYLVMVGSNQCSFRNKADYEATQKKMKEGYEIPVVSSIVPKPTEETTEPTIPSEVMGNQEEVELEPPTLGYDSLGEEIPSPEEFPEIELTAPSIEFPEDFLDDENDGIAIDDYDDE